MVKENMISFLLSEPSGIFHRDVHRKDSRQEEQLQHRRQSGVPVIGHHQRYLVFLLLSRFFQFFVQKCPTGIFRQNATRGSVLICRHSR